jgi:microcystin-dependent protein
MIINTDLVYPIGSIYISVNNVNPSKYFGGTWVAFAAGRTLVGMGSYTDGSSNTMDFNTIEYSFGEYKHKLTITEMPAHNHRFNYYNQGTGGGANGLPYNIQNTIYVGQDTAGMINTGGSQSHNTCQPSITVYMWKRTA